MKHYFCLYVCSRLSINLIILVLYYSSASLVPTFSFGENEIYQQVPNFRGSKIRNIQEFLQTYLSFAPLLFFGRGMFQYSFGIVPYRTPIYTVGKLIIDLKLLDNISKRNNLLPRLFQFLDKMILICFKGSPIIQIHKNISIYFQLGLRLKFLKL